MYSLLFVYICIIYAISALGPRVLTGTWSALSNSHSIEVNIIAGYGNVGAIKDGINITLTSTNVNRWIAVAFPQPNVQGNAMNNALGIICVGAGTIEERQLGNANGGSVVGSGIGTASSCDTAAGTLTWEYDAGYDLGGILTIDPNANSIGLLTAYGGSTSFGNHNGGNPSGGRAKQLMVSLTCSGDCDTDGPTSMPSQTPSKTPTMNPSITPTQTPTTSPNTAASNGRILNGMWTADFGSSAHTIEINILAGYGNTGAIKDGVNITLTSTTAGAGWTAIAFAQPNVQGNAMNGALSITCVDTNTIVERQLGNGNGGSVVGSAIGTGSCDTTARTITWEADGYDLGGIYTIDPNADSIDLLTAYGTTTSFGSHTPGTRRKSSVALTCVSGNCPTDTDTPTTMPSATPSQSPNPGSDSPSNTPTASPTVDASLGLGPRILTGTFTGAGNTVEINILAGYGNSGPIKDGINITVTSTRANVWIAGAIGISNSNGAAAMNGAVGIVCDDSSNNPREIPLNTGSVGSPFQNQIGTGSCTLGSSPSLTWSADGYDIQGITIDPDSDSIILLTATGNNAASLGYHGSNNRAIQVVSLTCTSGACPRVLTGSFTGSGNTVEINIRSGYGNSGPTKDGVSISVTPTTPNVWFGAAIGISNTNGPAAMNGAVSFICDNSGNNVQEIPLGTGSAGSPFPNQIGTSTCNFGSSPSLTWEFDGYDIQGITIDPMASSIILLTATGNNAGSLGYHGSNNRAIQTVILTCTTGCGDVTPQTSQPTSSPTAPATGDLCSDGRPEYGTEPITPPNLDDEDIKVGIKINCDNENVEITIEAPDNIYVGIVFGDSMVSNDEALVVSSGKSGNDAIECVKYDLTDYDQSGSGVNPSQTNTYTTDTNDVSGGRRTIKCVQSLSNSAAFSLETIEVKYGVAYGDSTTLEYHTTNRRISPFSVNLETGGVETEPENKLRIVHGVTMWIAWNLCAYIGIFSSANRYLFSEKSRWWFFHRLFQCSAVFFSVLGWIFMIIAKTQSDRKPLDNLKDAHQGMGFTIILIGILQPINAIFRGDHAVRNCQRISWEYIHKSLGYIALILSAPTVLLGLRKYDVNALFIIEIIYIVILLILFIFCKVRGCNREDSDDHHTNTGDQEMARTDGGNKETDELR